MNCVLVMVLYSYSSGVEGSYRPSTMATDTTVIEFKDAQSCNLALNGVLYKFKLPKQDRLETGVRVEGVCLKK